jgi:hypothetical protein
MEDTMFGISPLLFIHVTISLIGIATGLVVLHGMVTGRPDPTWTTLFLVSTILTSFTGFPLPAGQLLPSHIFGILSLVLLAAAVVALYVFDLSGAWRWIFVVCSVTALYLNVFVGVVQSFQKLPFLSALAPTQAEPPFVIAQLFALGLFIVFGFLAVRRFHPAPANA